MIERRRKPPTRFAWELLGLMVASTAIMVAVVVWAIAALL